VPQGGYNTEAIQAACPPTGPAAACLVLVLLPPLSAVRATRCVCAQQTMWAVVTRQCC
jgi:hypothetical protein